VPGQEREVVAALREPVREGTGEAGAGSDDHQVAWIGGGAIGPGGVRHCRPPFLDAR
jgi:hypothetical protein